MIIACDRSKKQTQTDIYYNTINIDHQPAPPLRLKWMLLMATLSQPETVLKMCVQCMCVYQYLIYFLAIIIADPQCIFNLVGLTVKNWKFKIELVWSFTFFDHLNEVQNQHWFSLNHFISTRMASCIETLFCWGKIKVTFKVLS